MTNKELQDALNGRLEKFGGEKYTGKEACTPVYHRWYMHEIESELESRGIEIFRAATWKIVAEIDGPGDLRVGYEPVASVNVEIKRDKRYKFGGPGVVKSIRVQFREDLQGLTIEETRAYLLKADLKKPSRILAQGAGTSLGGARQGGGKDRRSHEYFYRGGGRMKTAAELWADTIKKQPIDDLTIKHTCESIEELINKKTTGVRLAGLLSRAEAIILRQRKEIAALHKAAEVEHE